MSTAVVRFGDITLHPIPHPEHEWTLTSVEIVEALECDPSAVRHAIGRHGAELLEGRHWYSVTERHAGKQPRTIWTKRGLIRLSFFVRSAKAIAFRDWAEDLVLSVMEGSVNQVAELAAAFDAYKADTERRLAALEAAVPRQGRLFALPVAQRKPVPARVNVGAVVARKAEQRTRAINAIAEADGVRSIRQLASLLNISWFSARTIVEKLVKDGTIIAEQNVADHNAIALRVAS